MTMNSFSIYLDICTAQQEGGGEEGEAQSPEPRRDSDSRAHNGPLCPPATAPSSSTTPSTQRPVYLPPGPGSVSGATPAGPPHTRCQTLCPRALAWQPHTFLGTPPSLCPTPLPATPTQTPPLAS